MRDKEKTSILEIITLGLVQTGSKKKNFKILCMIPTSIEKIMKETGLSKVPANNRVNELEKVGLVKRRKGTGLVAAGPHFEVFMKSYEKVNEIIKVNLYKYLASLA